MTAAAAQYILLPSVMLAINGVASFIVSRPPAMHQSMSAAIVRAGEAFHARPFKADVFFQDAGGPSIPLRLGRKDAAGPESKQPEGNLPGEALLSARNMSCQDPPMPLALAPPAQGVHMLLGCLSPY